MTTAPAWAVFEARGFVMKGAHRMTMCPGHADDKASLKVDVTEDGRVLLKCFASCTAVDVLDAVGLKLADLFPPRGADWKPAPSKMIARYPYTDENDVVLYENTRWDPKDFRIMACNPDGSWKRDAKGKCHGPAKGDRWVLWHLSKLLKAPGRPVVLVEGEKDVLAWERLGMLATCCAGGAGAWRSEYAESLQGRTVLIVPDNDDPGAAFAMEAKGWLARGLVVPLPGLALHGDSSDWIAAGGTAKQLAELARARARAEIANAGEILRSLGG